MSRLPLKIMVIAVLLLAAGVSFAAPYQLTYGGRLTESSGRPVASPVNLRVTFYRSFAGNDQVAVTIPDFMGVVLQDGLFQVQLSLSLAEFHAVFNGTNETFIQIEDLGHGVTYPRQKFSAVPYALKVPVDGDSITYDVSGRLALGNGAYTLKLPNAAGSLNKLLKSDGNGGLVWADDLSGGGAGSITGTEIQNGAITNDHISNTAAISHLKISGLGSAASKNVGTGSSDVAAGNHGHAAGDIAGLGSLAAKSTIGSADITDGSITGTDIASSTITDANVNAAASIAHTKIAGLGNAATKNVGTAAGDVAAGNHSHADATTAVSGFMSNGDKVRLNAAVVTTDTGTVTGTMIADGAIDGSKVADGAISLVKLSATICGANQVLKMNGGGTALTCAADATSSGSYVAKSADYAVATSDNDKLIDVTNQTTITLLPAATAGAGFRVTIKRSGTSLVKVAPDGTENIDGQNLAIVLVTPNSAITLMSSGSSWVIAAKDGVYGRSNNLLDFSCGGASDSCYDDTFVTAFGYAVTPGGKTLEYVLNMKGRRIWKEIGGVRILKPNGSDNWAMKLNNTGKGLSGVAFASWEDIEGRVCPPNVYVDDGNKFTTGNCLYYTSEADQALDKDGTNDIDGMDGWSVARWYAGNVAACAAKGMRLPALFETTTTVTTDLYYPTSDGNPTFAQADGVPPEGGSHTWTATTATNSSINYWAWNTGTLAQSYSSKLKLRCVLP